jgi:hypothetical protein
MLKNALVRLSLEQQGRDDRIEMIYYFYFISEDVGKNRSKTLIFHSGCIIFLDQYSGYFIMTTQT